MVSYSTSGVNGDVASAVARPVRGEAAGDFVVAVSVDPEFRVSAVDGVRFPAGIGTVKCRGCP